MSGDFSTVTLRADNEETVERAAQFVAALFKAGVRFDATEDLGRVLGGPNCLPIITVNLKGY
jgi:hypothetical protein